MARVSVVALATAAASVGFMGLILTADAADGPAPASQPDLASVYAAVAKLPDWSGAWEADTAPSVLETNAALPLTPKYAALLNQARADFRKTKILPLSAPANPQCKPRGMPLFMETKGPLYEFLYAPGVVAIGSGSNEERVIPTDGRALPPDPDPDSFRGTSRGIWQGDTLVVETDGIVAEADVFPGIENGGHLRISERIRKTGADKIEDTITLTDADIFTAPYTYTRSFTRRPQWEVTEYVCLTQTRADYGVGPVLTPEQDKQSAWGKPPVRRAAEHPADASALPGSSWETIAKLPDWQGVWTVDLKPMEVTSNEPIPLNEPYAAKLVELRQISKDGGDTPSNVVHCRPRGALNQMKTGSPAVSRIVFTPGRTTIVPENAQARRIYTDGRKHPAQTEPSFMGHSIGTWEKNADGAYETLAVDSANFRDDIELFKGMPSGGALHLIERVHLLPTGKLKIDFAMNSAALNGTWTYDRTYQRHRDWDLMEEYCVQNNRSIDPKTGDLVFDTTPPPG